MDLPTLFKEDRHMNRNPGRPKIMRPCTCEIRYQECNCEWLAMTRPPYPGYIYIPAMVMIVSAAIVGVYYLLRF